ncbi:hypothetical protein EOL96_02260 [Candidatus Saccharibacteria bacterium]|nr:hypothetical protein [Candidatus Saccharibacteria bacterium]
MPRHNYTQHRQPPARKIPTKCTKAAYSSQQIAERAAIRGHEERQQPLATYLCTQCGAWHLTRQQQSPHNT